MLDGGSNGGEAWSLFGDGYIPHNVVLDHNFEVLYTSSGFYEDDIMEAIALGLSYVPRDEDDDGVLDSLDNCFDTPNPDQLDIDLDGLGDACDPCDNANIFTYGNTNGTVDTGGDVTVDVFDILSLVEIVLSGDTESCGYQISDYTLDGSVNVIDVIALVQLVLSGTFDNSLASFSGDGHLEIEKFIDGDKIMISSEGRISGLQFELNVSDNHINDIENIILPDSWLKDYQINDNVIKVLLFDGSGQNSKDFVALEFSEISVSSLQNVIVSGPDANQIHMTFSEKSGQNNDILIPENPKIHKLYPNPFNPMLSISISIPKDDATSITIFNTNGEEVDVISDSKILSAGYHTFYWDARNNPSGMYIVKIKSGSSVNTKKALLLK
tara:strand:- start:140 stop:1288 length:1149 start_codon:yes stop_codon:yes gene_type:complete